MSKIVSENQLNVANLDLEAGRRAFLKSIGLFTAGAATLGLGVTAMPEAAEAAGIDDPTILNFALNLEYLEAEFYLHAVTGKGLASGDVTGTGKAGGVIGGSKVKFDTAIIGQYAEEIAGDEEAHVKFLRSALGSAKVARPEINLKSSFTAAARAAGLVGKNEQFDAFASETAFLLAAFIFEDVGVTAYKGAARYITNKDYLEAAAGILAVEAYHAGEIRTLLASKGLFDQARAISNARDSLDGKANIDQGVGTPKKVNIVPTDTNGLAFSRTPHQVLGIVYLGDGPSSASFFPKGLNGAVK
jgi:hypothetical protein